MGNFTKLLRKTSNKKQHPNKNFIRWNPNPNKKKRKTPKIKSFLGKQGMKKLKTLWGLCRKNLGTKPFPAVNYYISPPFFALKNKKNGGLKRIVRHYAHPKKNAPFLPKTWSGNKVFGFFKKWKKKLKKIFKNSFSKKKKKYLEKVPKELN